MQPLVNYFNNPKIIRILGLEYQRRKPMEERQEKLLQQLEAEGKQIAKYRKHLLDLVKSGQFINCSKMLQICNELNTHISSFDQINDQLIALESAS